MDADQSSRGWEELRIRLDVVIMLLLDRKADDGVSMTEKVRRLLDLGLTKADVARIVGKPTNYVTAITSKHRRVK